jgi:hypothetical protein
MKKIMTLTLGLSLLLGGVAIAADEKPATGETAKTEEQKKKVKKASPKKEVKPEEAKKK